MWINLTWTSQHKLGGIFLRNNCNFIAIFLTQFCGILIEQSVIDWFWKNSYPEPHYFKISKLSWMIYIPGIHYYTYFVRQNIPQISQQFKPNYPLDNNVYTIQWTSAPVIGLCVSTNSSQLHNWWQHTGCHTCYMSHCHSLTPTTITTNTTNTINLGPFYPVGWNKSGQIRVDRN